MKTLMLLLAMCPAFLFSQHPDKPGKFNQMDEKGMRQGYWKTYFDEKQQHLISEGRFKDGKETGVWKFYMQGGSIYKKGNRSRGSLAQSSMCKVSYLPEK